jgi:DNA-binding NarL/FixJ family response regulator
VTSGQKTPGSTRVAIVDDHELLAQTLRAALVAEGLDVEVPVLSSPQDVLDQLRSNPADVVLLDLDLGSFGRGENLVASLVETGARVIVVTGSANQMQAARCVELGAHGLVDKTRPFEELLRAVLDAANLRTIISQQQRSRLLAELSDYRRQVRERLAPFRALTPRESQVLAALCEGLSVEAIAQRWFVSEATVRSQVHGVLSKLGVTSQLAAVAAAQRASWSIAAIGAEDMNPPDTAGDTGLGRFRSP